MGSIILLYIFPPSSLEWAAGLDHCECQTKKRSKTRCGCESCCQCSSVDTSAVWHHVLRKAHNSPRPCMHILHVCPDLEMFLTVDSHRTMTSDSHRKTRDLPVFSLGNHITHAVAPPTMTCLCSLSQEFLALGIAPNIFTAWDGILSPPHHACLSVCSALLCTSYRTHVIYLSTRFLR